MDQPIAAVVRADGAGLSLDSLNRAALRNLAGQKVEIRRVRRRRSNPQNAWAWSVAYPLLAEALGYDKDEIEDLHYALVAKCFGTHVDERLGIEVANVRSSKLPTNAYSEYMEWLVRFAARYGCVIPLPNEEL